MLVNIWLATNVPSLLLCHIWRVLPTSFICANHYDITIDAHGCDYIPTCVLVLTFKPNEACRMGVARCCFKHAFEKILSFEVANQSERELKFWQLIIGGGQSLQTVGMSLSNRRNVFNINYIWPRPFCKFDSVRCILQNSISLVYIIESYSQSNYVLINILLRVSDVAYTFVYTISLKYTQICLPPIIGKLIHSYI